MAIRDWSLLAAGLLLAGVGLGAFLFGNGGEPSALAEISEPALGPTAETIMLEADLAEAPLQVKGISGAVARVLGRNGGAEVIGSAELDLPGPILRVLQENQVVLTLPEERPAAVQVAR